jgi:hypothetical protein
MQQKSDRKMGTFVVENNAPKFKTMLIFNISQRESVLKYAKEKHKTQYSERPLQPQIRHMISM